MSSKPKIIAIVGPTASGKTDLALVLARKLNGEIIAADSRTVYKKMDIGTAKPKGVKRKVHGENAIVVNKIPTFLMNLVEPDQIYTVADFQKDARRIINKIVKARKLPIIVGGTGFYIQALIENYELPVSNPKIRLKLEKQFKVMGLKYLVAQLKKLDPKTQVDLQNPRRVVRALEVCLATAKPFSQTQNKGETHYNPLILGINVPRTKLYKRIDARVKQMIDVGLEKEVRSLAKKYEWSSPGINALGYRQFKSYFEKRATLDQVIEEIQKQTRHYAKRQMTWFKKMPGVKWIKTKTQANKLISFWGQ